MNIKFENIKIHYFMSFGSTELNLNSSGYTMVSGVNNNPDDMARSNGSGKSSIFEAIIWALTGETIRGTKDIVNKASTDGTFVELNFNIDNDTYKVIRYKDYAKIGTNLKVFINGEDKSGKGIRDTEKILEQLIPDLTASLIGSVIILGQGLPQRFTNNTPSGRKDVLEKLSKSDFMIEDIKDKLSSRKIQLNEDLRYTEDLILANTSKKELLDKQLQKLKEDKALLVPVDFDAEIAKNQKQLDFLIDNQIDCYNLSLKLEEAVNNKLKEYQDWTAKVNDNYLHECTVLDKQYNLVAEQRNIISIESDIKSREAEIKRLESIKDVCPTCGQKLPDVHKVDTTTYKVELDSIKESLKIVQENYTNKSNELKLKKQAVFEKLNKDTESIKLEGQELRKQLNETNEENNSYLKEINNLKLTIDKIKLNKESYEKQSQTIDKDISDCECSIENISKEILYNNIERDRLKQKIDIVNKMTTIATRDFRGFLLSEVINFIKQRAIHYSLNIFETDKIDFKLDGNNILISYCDKQYENLSGGEKQKVDLIIQFAIRDMLVQFSNFSSNILVLDEIFDNLDDIGCQRVLNLITNSFVDVSSIFIITHHTDIDIPYDSRIVVTKNDTGISEIAYET